ncbi:MAG: DUF2087 domain-containing protein [Pseudomonadota bacterium]
MTRTVFPFAVSDVSALARALRRELAAAGGPPGHVQLLNILARAAGFRNFQHFRAQGDVPAPAAPSAAPADQARVERVARCFDAEGRLERWPARTGDQRLSLWVLWSRIPPDEVMTEQQVSARIEALHRFGDRALLRRELVETGLVSRTPDCRQYRRVEQRPPAEALALIREVASGERRAPPGRS